MSFSSIACRRSASRPPFILSVRFSTRSYCSVWRAGAGYWLTGRWSCGSRTRASMMLMRVAVRFARWRRGSHCNRATLTVHERRWFRCTDSAMAEGNVLPLQLGDGTGGPVGVVPVGDAVAHVEQHQPGQGHVVDAERALADTPRQHALFHTSSYLSRSFTISARFEPVSDRTS